MSEENYIIKLHIDQSTNPWSGMTGSYQEEEKNKSISAKNINNTGFKFFPNLEKYKINNKNLIGKSTSENIIAVESSIFSDLKRFNATGFSQNQDFIIGKIKVLKNIKLRDLSLFLIESQIIQTFAHIEANLSLTKEEDSENDYTAYFKGEHIYFTNEKNVSKVSFRIVINKKTGEMSVLE